MPPRAPITIERATAAERPRALALLLQSVPPELRLEQIAAALRQAQHDPDHLDLLLVARQDGTTIGAVWGQPMAGRTALVWPPQVIRPDGQPDADELLRELCRRLAPSVSLAQIVFEHEPSDDQRDMLRRHAFTASIRLAYLYCTSDKCPECPPDGPLEFAPWQNLRPERQAELLTETYQETLDAPVLNHKRDPADVLEGYRATGTGSDTLWFTARLRGDDVGCLLLADHTAADHLELMYMGLKPAARGHRGGLQMARFAQWMTRQRERRQLILAVDAANDPAIRAYSTAAFQPLAERFVLLRFFDDAGWRSGRREAPDGSL